VNLLEQRERKTIMTMEFTIAAYPSNPPKSTIAAHKNKDLYFINSSLCDSPPVRNTPDWENCAV